MMKVLLVIVRSWYDWVLIDWNWDDPFILESRESDQEASKDQNIVDEATSTSNERWVEEICFHWVIVLTWHPNQSLEHQFFR